MKASFYIKVKGRRKTSYGYDGWDFPPIYTDVIEASSKKEVRQLIDEIVGKQLPLKTSTKDDEQPFLLSVTELLPNTHDYIFLLEEHKCPVCGITFKRIDQYRNQCGGYYSIYCSNGCRNDDIKRVTEEMLGKGIRSDMDGGHQVIIYKITNKNNNQCYIGKTTQAFTFRWYQHIFQNQGSTKFHQALNNSKITDWTFEVIEIMGQKYDLEHRDILEREQYYINLYDSINNGYNTVVSLKTQQSGELDLI